MRRTKYGAIVLDTWAMFAYLKGEPSAQEVRQALRRAKRNEIEVLFSLINYGECLYMIERKRGIQQVHESISVIDHSSVVVVPADRSLVFAAARLKARYPISYADAFAAALAKRSQASLMTGDPEFKAVEQEIAIHWLASR